MFNVMLAAAPQGAGVLNPVLTIVIFMAIFWFLIIRPQKKKDQQTKSMQDSLAKGDKIITIGGIVGTVISVKDEDVVIETGSDKAKLVFKKWAIGAVENKNDKKADKAEKNDKKADKKSKKEAVEAPEVAEAEVAETTEE